MNTTIIRIIQVFLFFLISIFSINFSFAQQLYDLILSDDQILNDIRFLSIESKTPFLSFSPPFTQDEIINFLEKIDTETLSLSALTVYDRIEKRLKPEASLSFSVTHINTLIDINAAIEGGLRFNNDIPWDLNESEPSPLISIPVRFHFSHFVQLYLDTIISIKTGIENDDFYKTNLFFNASDFDERTPRRSFMAVGGDWWSFQIGKDKIRWGTALSGSLTFNDSDAFYDFARLSLFSSNVKYTVLINQMKLDTKNLPMIFKNDLIDYSEEWKNDAIKNTTHRYYYLHRLDFSFFNKLSVSLMEGLMTGNSALELRYLNPIILYHSLISWNDYDRWYPLDDMKNYRADMVGSILSLEINFNIINSLAIYGQFVMNEFQLPSEKYKDNLIPPNALGYLAGVSYTHSFQKWISFSYLEFIYTDPYLSILSSPFGSFIKMHHSSNQIRYIGYPRDTIALTTGTIFYNNDNLSLRSDFSYIIKGMHDRNGITWNWSQLPGTFDEKTPTGIPENIYNLSLGINWNIIQNLYLNGKLSGIISVFDKDTKYGGQVSLGFKYHL